MRKVRAGRLVTLVCALVVALGAALLVHNGQAQAKATYHSPYTKKQTFNAALRLIRVDHNFNITERDPDAAYLLFDYKSAESGGRTTPGSIELIEQRDSVTVVVQLPRMPRYHEEVLVDELRRKLETELGEPPKRAPAREERPDAGADADAGDSGQTES